MAQDIERKEDGTVPMTTPLPEDSNLVRPYDKVKVYATDKGGFHTAGEEIEVHPILAEKLIKAGTAVKDKPKTK